MRRRPPVTVLLLATAGLALGGCGGSSGLLSSGSADDLQQALQQAESAFSSGECSQASKAVQEGLDAVQVLPDSVDDGLRSRLRSGFTKLDKRIDDCEQAPPTTTTAPPTTTEAVPTETTTTDAVPTETTTTDTSTTETTDPSTDTSPDDGGLNPGQGPGNAPDPGSGGISPGAGPGAGAGGAAAGPGKGKGKDRAKQAERLRARFERELRKRIGRP